MTALTAAVHLLAAVLVVSGAQKLLSPDASAVAMRGAGLPVPFPDHLAGRALGLVEAAIGLAAIAVPETWATISLGLFYAALTVFVLRLRQTDASAGCGCFGSSSTPPGTAHLVLNGIATGVAAGAAFVGVVDIVDILDDSIAVATSYLALLGIGSGLLLLGPVLAASLADARSGGNDVPQFAITSRGPVG